MRCESYNEGITNALNNSSNDSLLGTLLGLLGLTLAVVLTCWIVTCVYLQRKINRYKLKTNFCACVHYDTKGLTHILINAHHRQAKDHAHPVSPSGPAFQLDNPVYDGN